MYVDVRRWSIKRKQEMAKTRLGQQDLIFFSQGGDPWPVSLAETSRTWASNPTWRYDPHLAQPCEVHGWSN